MKAAPPTTRPDPGPADLPAADELDALARDLARGLADLWRRRHATPAAPTFGSSGTVSTDASVGTSGTIGSTGAVKTGRPTAKPGSAA